MLADALHRRSLIVLLLATACSAPATEKKGLPLCDDGDPACSSGGDKEAPRRSTGPTGPSTSPVKGEELPSADPYDAGAGVDASKAVEPSCVNLDKCCEELQTDGYDPTTCQGIVSTNNNAACYNSLESYRSYGDCR
jgi:hypothetical protein